MTENYRTVHAMSFYDLTTTSFRAVSSGFAVSLVAGMAVRDNSKYTFKFEGMWK